MRSLFYFGVAIALKLIKTITRLIYQLIFNNDMNTQLVESIYQVIQSFSDEE